MKIEPLDDPSLNMAHLDKELDKAKSSMFLGKNAAFLGSLLCSLNFQWTRSVKTAATNSVDLFWNPDFFIQLDPLVRETILEHELWHAARLHHIRLGSRDPMVWNQACDIRINNDLEREGRSFLGVEGCWKDKNFDANGIMAEEDIYDLLKQNPPPPPPSGGGGGSWDQGDSDGDMLPLSNGQQQTAINNVVQAIQQAKIAGQGGNIPGGIEEMISKFLDPVVPWEQVLMQFFTDLLHEDYSWKRPNRRYQDMYLPSRFTDDGRLEHLMYFLDVSGSISDKDILRFNSEVKYIQEVLKPQRLSLVQFDTRITIVKEFREEDPFDEIKVVGRGGTAWEPVRAYIEEHCPTAAVIFTDMGFWDPITPLNYDVPVIWAIQGNPHTTGPYGKSIHIK